MRGHAVPGRISLDVSGERAQRYMHPLIVPRLEVAQISEGMWPNTRGISYLNPAAVSSFPSQEAGILIRGCNSKPIIEAQSFHEST